MTLQLLLFLFNTRLSQYSSAAVGVICKRGGGIHARTEGRKPSCAGHFPPTAYKPTVLGGQPRVQAYVVEVFRYYAVPAPQLAYVQVWWVTDWVILSVI